MVKIIFFGGAQSDAPYSEGAFQRKSLRTGIDNCKDESHYYDLSLPLSLALKSDLVLKAFKYTNNKSLLWA